jgi:signal transduction histidine kinase
MDGGAWRGSELIGRLSLFGRFVRDRAVYVAAFIICALSLIAVVAMDGGGMALGNLIYLFVLASFFILAALVIDFARHASFTGQLHHLLKRGDRSPDAVISLPEGVTLEQQLFRSLLLLQHRNYSEKSAEYRKTEERRHLFTNQWVHQMKTPVSVIDLLVQQADEAETAEEQHRLLSSVGEESERLARGLDMVLHQARLENFEGDVQLKRINVRETVRKVINEHKKTLIRASIFPQVSGKDAWVETDEKWFIFVLSQLVSNAVKYSKIKEDNKKLVIGIEQGRGQCTVSVTDEGIGIASHELDRVFHPYFTGENGRLTGESTGMGLYLASEVCRRLGHSLDIQSEKGSGTTVTIRVTGSAIHDFIHNDDERDKNVRNAPAFER